MDFQTGGYGMGSMEDYVGPGEYKDFDDSYDDKGYGMPSSGIY